MNVSLWANSIDQLDVATRGGLIAVDVVRYFCGSLVFLHGKNPSKFSIFS